MPLNQPLNKQAARPSPGAPESSGGCFWSGRTGGGASTTCAALAQHDLPCARCSACARAGTEAAQPPSGLVGWLGCTGGGLGSVVPTLPYRTRPAQQV